MTVVRCVAGLAAIVTAMLVQATLVGPLLYPVPVSLPLLLVVAVAVLSGPSTGIALGFGAGLLGDLNSHHPVGVLALTWLGAGIVAGVVGGVVMTPGQATASGRRPSDRRSSQRRGLGLRTSIHRRLIRRSPARSSQRRQSDRARTSRWQAQALLTGLVAAAASGVSLALVATLGDDVRALPGELILLVPGGLIDAMLAVVVLALARAMLASPALRPVTPVRLGGDGPVVSLPMDLPAGLPLDVPADIR